MTAKLSKPEKKPNIASDRERTRSNLLCKSCGLSRTEGHRLSPWVDDPGNLPDV